MKGLLLGGRREGNPEAQQGGNGGGATHDWTPDGRVVGDAPSIRDRPLHCQHPGAGEIIDGMSAQPPRGLTVLDHPLIRHKMALLRAATTTSRDFKQLVGEIAALMTYEVTRDLPTGAGRGGRRRSRR